MNQLLAFFEGKRVLVTGCTGFKGSWLTQVLLSAGAKVCGYALQPQTTPALFDLAHCTDDPNFTYVTGDVRNFSHLKRTLEDFAPDIVFHLAAQPLVREGYRQPRLTYETNIMGTVNVLEAVRTSGMVRSFVNVTTDKVYRNNEWVWGYREDERLDGFDPYSNSKSCSDMLTHTYVRSFPDMPPTSTMRAGNVIGGGDFSPYRLIPDCVRAAVAGKKISLRNPSSIRPYQYVLDPLFAYLMVAKGQYEDASLAGAYNIGPEESDCVSNEALVSRFCAVWNRHISPTVSRPDHSVEHSESNSHTSNFTSRHVHPAPVKSIRGGAAAARFQYSHDAACL